MCIDAKSRRRPIAATTFGICRKLLSEKLFPIISTLSGLSFGTPSTAADSALAQSESAPAQTATVNRLNNCISLNLFIFFVHFFVHFSAPTARSTALQHGSRIPSRSRIISRCPCGARLRRSAAPTASAQDYQGGHLALRRRRHSQSAQTPFGTHRARCPPFLHFELAP